MHRNLGGWLVRFCAQTFECCFVCLLLFHCMVEEVFLFLHRSKEGKVFVRSENNLANRFLGEQDP